MEVLRIKNLKYHKNFQLTNFFLINTLLFVRIKQTSKIEVRKQPFKRVKIKKSEKSLKKIFERARFLVKLQAVGLQIFET